MQDILRSINAAPVEDADVFDRLDELLVPQDQDTRAGARKRLSVTVGRPGKNTFFRVQPDWTATAEFLEIDGDKRVLYLVLPGILLDIAEEAKLTVSVKTLYLYVDREGAVGLWPVSVGSDVADNRYKETAREALESAERKWVRVRTNQSERCYEVHDAVNQSAYGEPVFPKQTRNEILRAAFKERLIDSVEHRVIRQLLGAI